MTTPHSRREVIKLGMILGATAVGVLAGPELATASVRSNAKVLGATRYPTIAGAPGPGSFAGGQRGGAVTTVWSDAPQSFDPAVGWDAQSWEAITQLLYTPLLQFSGEHGLPAASAAASMPQYSADRKTVTIRLRPDVKFHNGRPVIAADYVYAWTRVLDPSLESWASSYLLGIEGAQKVYDGKAKVLSGVRALDDHTLQVQLTAPDITFESLLCQPYMVALPKEVVTKLGDVGFGRAPVGNGPFRSVSWNDQTRTANFDRFDDFFWTGTPFLDGVEYRWGITEALQLLQLEGGVASITGNGLSSDQAAMITSQGSAGAKYQQSVSVLGVDWVAMNIKGVLKDVRVRRALNYATDRRALAKTAFGTMTPWSLAFPKNLANYTRTATGYPYNPRKARSILKAAGYGRIALEFLHNGNAPWPNTAQILQQQWKRIGVDITITALGAAAFNEATSNQQGDLYGTDWFMVQPSALDEVSSCWVTDASSNYTGYSNKTVDKLAAAARTAPTIEASNALLAKVEQELGDDAAAIFTGSINFLVGRNPALQNFQYRGENGTYYDRLWIRKEH